MNRDILNIILNDVIYNDINSIKKTSLICKNIHNNIQILAMKNKIKSKLSILQKYINPDACMEHSASRGYMDIVQLMIEKGAQLCMDWNLAMRNAARGGHINIVQLMIEYCGQRSIYSNMAMKLAARGGHMNIFELLKQYQS